MPWTNVQCHDPVTIRFLVPDSISKRDQMREKLLGIRTLGGKLVLQNDIELHGRSTLIGFWK